MRIPRWSLLAAAVALALPVAGPALAAAAADGDVPVLSALTSAFTSEDCEDEGGQALDSEEDPATFAERSDTPEQGEDPCAGEDDEAPGDVVTDPEGPGDEEPDDDLHQDPSPDDITDDHLTDDEITEEEAAPEAEQLRHGALVSTVARCAPRGRDASELFGHRNHGAFVSAAARGGELDVLGETFDLSTIEGAEALCAFVADPPAPEIDEPEVGTPDAEAQDTVGESDRAAGSQRAAGNRPDTAGHAANHGKANGQGGGATGPKRDGAPGPKSGDRGAGPSGGKGNSGGNGNGGGPPAHAGKGGPDR